MALMYWLIRNWVEDDAVTLDTNYDLWKPGPDGPQLHPGRWKLMVRQQYGCILSENDKIRYRSIATNSNNCWEDGSGQKLVFLVGIRLRCSALLSHSKTERDKDSLVLTEWSPRSSFSFFQCVTNHKAIGGLCEKLCTTGPCVVSAL